MADKKLVITTHEVGNDRRFTVDAVDQNGQGFQKLVALVRNGKLIWKHKNITL